MSAPDLDESEIEASRAPLMDHLIELRSRLVICVVAFVVGFIVCFIFADPIYVFLVKPFAVAAQFREAAGPSGPVSPFDLILGTAGLAPVPQGDRLIYRTSRAEAVIGRHRAQARVVRVAVKQHHGLAIHPVRQQVVRVLVQ